MSPFTTLQILSLDDRLILVIKLYIHFLNTALPELTYTAAQWQSMQYTIAVVIRYYKHMESRLSTLHPQSTHVYIIFLNVENNLFLTSAEQK